MNKYLIMPEDKILDLLLQLQRNIQDREYLEPGCV